MYISIQFSRGLAAIGVAAFHLSMVLGSPIYGGTGERPFWGVVSAGDLGVDFFFVLSGFIILLAHQRDIGNPRRLANYFLRRAVRIFPIYWIYLIACIIGMMAVGSSHLKLSSPSEWLTAFTLVRFAQVEVPLAQAWTLFHEVVFYAIFASLLVSIRVGLAVLAIWAVSIGLTFHYTLVAEQSFASTVLGANNVNFLIGMLSFFMIKRMGPKIAAMCLIAGLILFAITHMIRAEGSAAEYTRLGYALAFGLIISSLAALEGLGQLKPPSWISLIGDASYSIYLLHEHAETYIVRGLLRLRWNQVEHQGITFAFVLMATVFIGCVAYILIERPLLRALQRAILRLQERPEKPSYPA